MLARPCCLPRGGHRRVFADVGFRFGSGKSLLGAHRDTEGTQEHEQARCTSHGSTSNAQGKLQIHCDLRELL
jgi:hypothetical protein